MSAISSLWDWTDVDLGKESQGVGDIDTTSIQYSVIQKIQNDGYSVIYDDDSGEIADIVAIKELEDKICIKHEEEIYGEC